MLQAESEEKMNEWITVLQNATANLLNSQKYGEAVDLVKHAEGKPSAYSGSPTDETLRTTGDSGPTLMESLRQLSGDNSVCSDCDTKSKNVELDDNRS